MGVTIFQKGVVDTFEIKGEKFVIIKKECLEELLILLKSVIEGERLLKEKRTRSFKEFLTYLSKREK